MKLIFAIIGIMFLGCQLPKKNSQLNAKRKYVFNPNEVGHMLIRLFDKGKPIERFCQNKCIISNQPDFFQYGELAAIFNGHLPYQPTGDYAFSFAFKGDTMKIETVISYWIKNIFIDSLPFLKGHYKMDLDLEMAHKQMADSSKYVSFANYFLQVQQKKRPPNPFEDYWYTPERRASGFIQQVLSKKYLTVKIKSIEPVK
jgi:hypothetical protein